MFFFCQLKNSYTNNMIQEIFASHLYTSYTLKKFYSLNLMFCIMFIACDSNLVNQSLKSLFFRHTVIAIPFIGSLSGTTGKRLISVNGAYRRISQP